MVKLLLLCFLLLAACGNDRMINGKLHETYGFINKDQSKDPNVTYRIITGNVIWGVVLVETLVMPLYFFGFSLYEPVDPGLDSVYINGVRMR